MTEPKTGREIGVWFTDQAWRGHRGSRIVLEMIHVDDKSEPKIPVYTTSACPACQMSSFMNRKILRWLILPP